MRPADPRFVPSDQVLRQFAALWIPFFAALGCWQGALRHRWILGGILLGLAFTLGPMGLLRPALLRPVFVTWMRLTRPIGWAVTHLVLALLYFGIFTPMGALFRLLGRDVLVRRRRRAYATYWTPRSQVRDMRTYLRQS